MAKYPTHEDRLIATNAQSDNDVGALNAEIQSLRSQLDSMFRSGEDFLIVLCNILEMDYTLETNATVIEKVKALKGQLAAWMDNEANMRRELEAVKGREAEAEQRGYEKARNQAVEIVQGFYVDENIPTNVTMDFYISERDIEISKIILALRPDPQPSEATA